MGLKSTVQCELCPKMCPIKPGQSGECRVRINIDGLLRTVVYAFPHYGSIHVDPVEKKPLFHFLPGTGILSLATVGCNLHSRNCQNWEISQANPEDSRAAFCPPEKLVDLWKKKDFGSFMDKNLNDVPVGLLYDADTTGGNSGSPVLDNKGRLVGINFDRAFEATINDYAWNASYSRSIGVDIRYVLFILEKFAGADRLLNEMKVK